MQIDSDIHNGLYKWIENVCIVLQIQWSILKKRDDISSRETEIYILSSPAIPSPSQRDPRTQYQEPFPIRTTKKIPLRRPIQNTTKLNPEMSIPRSPPNHPGKKPKVPPPALSKKSHFFPKPKAQSSHTSNYTQCSI